MQAIPYTRTQSRFAFRLSSYTLESDNKGGRGLNRAIGAERAEVITFQVFIMK